VPDLDKNDGKTEVEEAFQKRGQKTVPGTPPPEKSQTELPPPPPKNND
jgi:hypothetical protein